MMTSMEELDDQGHSINKEQFIAKLRHRYEEACILEDTESWKELYFCVTLANKVRSSGDPVMGNLLGQFERELRWAFAVLANRLVETQFGRVIGRNDILSLVISQCEKLIELEPNDIDAFLLKSKACFATRRWRDVRITTQDAIARFQGLEKHNDKIAELSKIRNEADLRRQQVDAEWLVGTNALQNNVQRRPRGLNKREAGTRKHPRQKPIVKEKSGPSHGTLKKYVPADVTPKKSSRSAIPKVHQNPSRPIEEETTSEGTTDSDTAATDEEIDKERVTLKATQSDTDDGTGDRFTLVSKKKCVRNRDKTTNGQHDLKVTDSDPKIATATEQKMTGDTRKKKKRSSQKTRRKKAQRQKLISNLNDGANETKDECRDKLVRNPPGKPEPNAGVHLPTGGASQNRPNHDNSNEWPLQNEEYKIVCKNCIEFTGLCTVKWKQECHPDCLENVLIVKGKTVVFNTWNIIRERPEYAPHYRGYEMCRKISRACHVGCTFAHNNAELNIWNLCRTKRFSLQYFILKNRSIKSKLFSPDDVLAKHTGSFQFLCKSCFERAPQEISQRSETNGAVCSSESCHRWTGDNLVLVHVTRRNNSVTYTPIRAIPPQTKTSKEPLFLCNFGKNCWNNDGCTFAHSSVELDFWTCQRDTNSSKEIFVEKSQRDAFKIPNDKSEIGKEEVIYRRQDRQQRIPKRSWETGRHHELPGTDVKRTVTTKTLYCELCEMNCNSDIQWHQHCSSKKHTANLFSDNTRIWNYRLPPFVTSVKEFRMCKEHQNGSEDETSTCTFAHSQEELDEWAERFNYRLSMRKKNRDKHMCSYMDAFIENHSSHLSMISSDEIGEYVVCDEDEIRYEDDKYANLAWNFSIAKKYNLKCVFLLHDEHRLHFEMSGGSQRKQQIIDNSQLDYSKGHCNVTVKFYGGLYGSFGQRVVFESRDRDIIIKNISIELAVGDVIQKISRRRKELDVKRWTEENSQIVKFRHLHETIDHFSEKIMKLYPAPIDTQLVSHQSLQYHLNKDNYVQKMHSVINLEELHMQSVVAKCQLTTDMEILQTIIDVSGVVINARRCQLFGKITLHEEFWDDSQEAFIIRTKCSGILLGNRSHSAKVYEAPFLRKDRYDIDGISKDCLYVCLSEECIRDMNLEADSTMEGQVQFVMDRSSFCRLHYGIDKLKEAGNVNLLFPHASIFKRPTKTYNVKSDFLNDKQMEVVRYAFLQHNHCTPPLVVYGPFGTGKTETLAQTAAYITMEEHHSDCRFLICTHTNSAADLYIKNHFHKINEELGDDTLSILRIYDEDRNLSTVDPVVKRYCKIRADPSKFVFPRAEEISECRIVIATLSTALLLSEMQLQKSFTHIFIDEAGQALEAEVLTPFILATTRACIVLAGDHIQTKNTMLSPDIKDEYNQSLLERLMKRYQDHSMNENKILLNENYRSHPRILRFISRIFYGGHDSLIPKSNEPDVPNVPPLAFYAVHGREERDSHSTSYRNVQEAMEIGEQVKRLYDDWPAEWGEKRMDAIAVVAYFPAQVQLIRSVLRRERLGNVTVENVRNVPGKEFQCIFISTVRTKRIIGMSYSTPEQSQLGFLTDPGILNTALTRAKGLVAIVGDPVALVSIGKCRSIWREYLEECIGSNGMNPPNMTLSDIELTASSQMANQPKYLMESPKDEEYGFDFDENPDTILHELATQSQNDQRLETNSENENINSKDTGIRCFLREKDGFAIVDNQQYFPSKQRRHLVSNDNMDDEYEIGSDISEEEATTNDEIYSRIGNDPSKYIECILKISSPKQIFAIPLDESETIKMIHISGRHNCGVAFSEDKVIIELFTTRQDDIHSGKVVKVTKYSTNRRNRLYICYPYGERFGLLVPINKIFPLFHSLSNQQRKLKGSICVYKYSKGKRIQFNYNHKIDPSKLQEQLFVVRYLKWERGFPFPLGLVVDVLKPGQDELSGMRILQLEYGLYEESKDVKNDIETVYHFDYKLPKSVYINRKQIRDLTFTIDPEGSEDLDDALSFSDLGNGNCRIGIHIADVAFFIPKDSLPDKHAFKRGTTYYRKNDSPIHMIPERLSTDLCSLKQGVDRLALSIFLACDQFNNIKLVENMPRRTIIKSQQKLTYKQVEAIINSKSVDVESTVALSNAIKRLYTVSRTLREKRMGNDSIAIHSDEDESDLAKSHALIEEFMILTNSTIADILKKSSICAPIRIQPYPAIKELNTWKECHENEAINSFGLSRYFHPIVDKDDMLHEICRCNGKCACIPRDTEMDDSFYMSNTKWEKIRLGVESDNFEEVRSAVLTFDQHPKTYLAEKHLHSILEHAVYSPSRGSNVEPLHFGLNVKSYTHYTSPIRRYIDLVVHRLIVALIENDQMPYTESEIDDICKRCTAKMLEAKDYQQKTCQLTKAFSLQNVSTVVCPVIDNLNDQGLTLRFPTLRESIPSSVPCPLNILGLCKVPHHDEERNSLELEWQMRIYDTRPDCRNRRNPLESHFVENIDGNRFITKIPMSMWSNLLYAVQHEHFETFKELFKSTESEVNTMKCNDYLQNNFKRDITCEVTEGMEMTKLHCNFKTRLSPCSVIQVQLESIIKRGLLSPTIQLINITPGVSICVEHRCRPVQSFDASTTLPASKFHYRNLQEYRNLWQKLLNMESAHQIVDGDDSCLVHHTTVSVPQSGDYGFIHLDEDFRLSRRIDLQCKKKEDSDATSNATSQDSTTDSAVNKSDEGSDSESELMSVGALRIKKRTKSFSMLYDYFCIRYYYKDICVEETNSPQWVAHAVSQKVIKKKDILIQFTSFGKRPPPDELKGKTVECTVEWFPKNLPLLRMEEALFLLDNASRLAQTIAQGTDFTRDEPAEDTNNSNFSSPHLDDLNVYQKKAVTEALTSPFTLIQGPPGTGKTITGARLACLYVEKNKREHPSQRHQVMYCGPSNKSVDVAARKLKEKDSISIVRVYSSQTELHCYPLPASIEPQKRFRREAEVDPFCNSIALHYIIRNNNTPGSEEINTLYDQIWKLSIQVDNTASDVKKRLTELKEKYKKAVTIASVKVLCSMDIIICTCVTSGRPLLSREAIKDSDFKVKQIIIDECGMCMESESMIPIVTFATAEHITLIGDHQQLQPIVANVNARELGLGVSLFQRYAYSRRNVMLKKQYRMQEQISQFPSEQFYGGKLECGAPQRQRQDSRLSIWPGGPSNPLVFCHVEGEEETMAVTSEEANQQSKSNLQEANEAVRFASQLLRYRSIKPENIVILSQYRAQCDKISKLLEEKKAKGISVTTVVKSQGSEWDYVLLSCVRSVPYVALPHRSTDQWRRRHLGFITDYHQINVAITRAKLGLIIIGNKHLLRTDHMWRHLLDHYEDKKAVVDSRTFMRR